MIEPKSADKVVEKDGERKVMLDKERTLRMDFNALALAEEMTGKNFLEPDTWQKLSAKDYRALTFACLVWEDQTLTIVSVGQMMTPKNEKQIGTALFDLYIGEVTVAPVDDAKTAEVASFKKDGGEEGQSRG